MVCVHLAVKNFPAPLKPKTQILTPFLSFKRFQTNESAKWYHANVNRVYVLCVSVCVQWPEGRCFHDVPESALLNLYFEIRENCHGFSWRRCQEKGSDSDHGRMKQRRSTKLIVAELRPCSKYRDRQWKPKKSFTIFVCFFPNSRQHTTTKPT